MAWGDMMGGAVGMGMGNGGSFAQKRPMMQQGGGFMQRPGMMKQQPPMVLGPKTRQMQQNYQQQSPEMQDWMMRRPPVGIAPLQGEAKDRWNQSYRDWQSQMPGQGQGTPYNKPGPNYRPFPQMGGNTGINGGRFPGMTPPYFPQQPQQPVGANDGPQRQTRDPNAPGYDPGFAGPMKGSGFQDMLRQIMGQFGQPREGMAQTQGGGMNDPRWSNGTWGGQRQGGIGPRIAPQMSMMPQMMQQPQQPPEEEQYY